MGALSRLGLPCLTAEAVAFLEGHGIFTGGWTWFILDDTMISLHTNSASVPKLSQLLLLMQARDYSVDAFNCGLA